MPTSILSAAAPALVSAGASFLGKSLFDSGQPDRLRNPTAPLQNFRPTSFSGGGLNARFSGDALSVTPTADRLAAVQGLGGSFSNLSNEIAALRPTVAPGISDLRAQRLREIENARTSAIGNLRENLARRRVLGSSFGSDALARAETEFAGAKDRVAAESFLQEFEMTNNLIQQQFAANRGAFQTGLDELNLEAGIATTLSASGTKAMGENAQFLSALNAKEVEGAGKFFGQTFQPVAKALGEGTGSFIKNTNFRDFFSGGGGGDYAAGGADF